jgi:glyoxylase-like metal-dependent hydrolase (beta-lactamase superfamily II)
MHWTVGKVKITKVVELETVGSTRFILPLATNEEIQKLPWLIPQYANEEGRLKMSIHSLLVETPSRRIIVDTGLGNDKQGRNVPTWNNRKDPFLDTLTAAGFPPDSIDTVLCTHLHVDHVGWNTRLENGRWVPTFPNARYLIAQREWDYWRNAGPAALQRTGDFITDSVLPIIESGQADMIGDEHAIRSDISIEPAHGHTPGQKMLRLSGGTREALLTADMIHHPLQLRYPEWSTNFCVDPDEARRTRMSFLEANAGSGRLVFPTHFPNPTGGTIERDGSAYRFVFDGEG